MTKLGFHYSLYCKEIYWGLFLGLQHLLHTYKLGIKWLFLIPWYIVIIMRFSSKMSIKCKEHDYNRSIFTPVLRSTLSEVLTLQSAVLVPHHETPPFPGCPLTACGPVLGGPKRQGENMVRNCSCHTVSHG